MDRRRWKKVAKKLVMPRLPGDWVVNDKGMMIRLPIGRVAQIITYDTSTYGGTNWGIWACAQPLYVVDDVLDYMQGLQRRQDFYIYSAEEVTLDQFWGLAGPFIEETVDFHARYGSVAGYLELCSSFIGQDTNDAFWNSWRGKAFSELCVADYDAAGESFVHVRDMLRRDMRQFELDEDDDRVVAAVEAERYIEWVQQDPEAARASLKGIERTQRAFFKLPPMEEGEQSSR